MFLGVRRSRELRTPLLKLEQERTLLRKVSVMKIRFLTGDKKGQISHAPVNQNTQLMVDAGLIEVLPWKNYQERLAAVLAPI
jgi:hypothetical protein